MRMASSDAPQLTSDVDAPVIDLRKARAQLADQAYGQADLRPARWSCEDIA